MTGIGEGKTELSPFPSFSFLQWTKIDMFVVFPLLLIVLPNTVMIR